MTTGHAPPCISDLCGAEPSAAVPLLVDPADGGEGVSEMVSVSRLCQQLHGEDVVGAHLHAQRLVLLRFYSEEDIIIS